MHASLPRLAAALLLVAVASGPALADDLRLVRRHGHGHEHGHEPVEPVRVRRAPVRPIHVHSHQRCGYDEGRYETRVRRVVVPGHYVESVEPARYEVRWSLHHGGYVRVLVAARRVVRTWVPARVEHRRERVWIPGGYRCGC